MTALLVDACLVVTVLSVWLGCLGFARLGTPLDRLHCVAFVNVAGGFALALGVLIEDGLTARSVKVVALVVILLVTGAATSHALGRSLLLRGGREP